MAISNATLWDAIRDKYPQFGSVTAKATKDTFTEAGWEALQSNPALVNDFFGLSMRTYLQMVNVSRAKDTLEAKGFGEYFDNPNGGIIQRMAVNSISPVSPKYKGLVDGSSVDPYVVRKPSVSERFFKRNFDYQSMITITDQYMLKDMFINQFGVDEFMTGIMTGLQNGYVDQLYLNKLEAISHAINSTKWALKDTQKYEVEISTSAPTADQLTNLILTIKNIVSALDLGPQTDAYNAAGFKSTQDISRLKLLVRPGYKNAIDALVLANAYNQERLNLPIDVIEVPHFGGLEPYKEKSYTTKLYEVYNNLGEVVKYNTAADGSGTDVAIDKVFWKDPNINVIGIIADKGVIFHSKQTGYMVEPQRNARGLYTNYFASSPNNTVAYDPVYNLVTISAKTPTK